MNSLSLYLHFPFCKKKCSYCDFYSLPRLELREAYEKALCRSLAAHAPEAKERWVQTVYFGGGTPSLATPDGVDAIFSTLRSHYRLAEEAEITVEMNPESTEDTVLSAYGRNGANRISFGMQSAIDTELACLGRLHRFPQVSLAVKRAKEAGFTNISLDLMYGLPGQTLASFRESLDRALSLDVQHLSFYLLTLSESVPLYAQREHLPSDEAVREMYLFALSYLAENGFEQYEISNAAKNGAYSRHNFVYWSGGDYLGFGPGAHSLFQGERFFVQDGVEEFILASNPLDRLSCREPLTREDRLTEYLMLSLRTVKGLDWAELEALSDAAFVKKTKEKFALWSKHGLCFATPQGAALTGEGFFVSNEIITELL